MDKSRIIVVGGGPAGMFAALQAATGRHEVLLLEKNAVLGRKLKITGGGRCNLTNIKDKKEHQRATVHNPKFLYKAFEALDPKSLIKHFEDRGCAFKLEKEGTVFPKSDDSSQIINILLKDLLDHGVDIWYNHKVERISVKDQKVQGVVLTDDREILADAVIITTGGASYPQTGSTGDGYIMAKDLGHGIKKIKPAITSFEIKERWVKTLAGISFTGTRVRILKMNKLQESGELLLTHYGISGPPVLKLSSYINEINLKENPVTVEIDFFPEKGEEELKTWFLDHSRGKKNLGSVLTEFWPKKFIEEILPFLGVPKERKMNELKKKERGKVIGALKGLQLTVVGLRPVKDAIVTAGGVDVKEVNPSTMESKKISGLYFAGEVLDLDAITGGYNLQIAFSTGFVAGNAASGKEEQG
ncbi:NAD(P)/FAD-dependent oxidoreductase [Isachenkonia alkalipeptolytica]|uniref:NAD(P)/FAD-dependent oxidoreductase n=1 Tax=Isachenkonia alkalipeptolytica TaxID=2565777 RepID=A0AA43XJ51_9CLOT|nr:NAD(P)/FAD-dependent oxidoreductase [Isachenkonia alkalipeptolytica]NBG87261.1 NAD(P)/FAD-dependent oxidoreductase [Isachenkonia alkalipeptolytica]